MTVSNTNSLKISELTDKNKQYDREFLIKLRDTPQCNIKPSYLIDRFKNIHKTDFKIPASNWNAGQRVNSCNGKSHHQLFPSFAKPSGSQPTQRRSSSQDNSARPRKSGMIQVSISLNADVKLRESENAWKSTPMKMKTMTKKEEETQVLYKKVRSALNKLTPENLDKLIRQVQALEINTQEKLQGVINVVFDKAVNEPNFAVAYVLLCKELALIKVDSPNAEKSSQKTGAASDNLSFRKLLITRCQVEFEKNKTDQTKRVEKLKEIENCSDVDKKKELQANLADYDRRIRMKSLGNIRFIGELYKQEMLTSNIMNLCINHLLKTPDEENLECLCKLLTTIGKVFEERIDLSSHIKKLTELINQQGKDKVSSRIRFMVQDVIDLRLNKWVPRHDNNNPKTISQIQKEAQTEQFINEHLNSSFNPSQGFRSDNRRKSLMGPASNNGWSVATNKSRQPYAIETSKLKINSTPIDEITLGSKNSYTWNKTALQPPAPAIMSLNKFSVLDSKHEEQNPRRRSYIGSSRSAGFSEKPTEKSFGRGIYNSQQRNAAPLLERRVTLMKNSLNNRSFSPVTQTETPKPASSIQSEFNESLNAEIIKSLFDICGMAANTDEFIKIAEETVADKFDNSSYEFFVCQGLNSSLEKSKTVRQRFSILLSYMIEKDIISLYLFQKEYKKLLELLDDLVIDIPKCQTYLVEILSVLMASGAHPFAELKQTLSVLKNTGRCGKFLGELLIDVAEDQTQRWVADEWKKSGLTWSDVFNTERESIDDIIVEYNLKFLTFDYPKVEKSVENIDFDKTLDRLLKFMHKNNSFDFITNHININFGEQSALPKFSRCLITAILTVSVDAINGSFKLNSAKFYQLLPLITRYVDADPKRELEVLFGVQHFIHHRWHPQGLLSSVIKIIYDDGIISEEAFLSWQKCKDPAEMEGHAIVIKSLTSFFVNLLEGSEDDSD